MENKIKWLINYKINLKLDHNLKEFLLKTLEQLIRSKKVDSYDGFVALGCVIKGKTPLIEFISNAVTNAIINLSITYKKPIGNGILTCLNKKQALKRLDKGKEASAAVMQVFSKI